SLSRHLAALSLSLCLSLSVCLFLSFLSSIFLSLSLSLLLSHCLPSLSLFVCHYSNSGLPNSALIISLSCVSVCLYVSVFVSTSDFISVTGGGVCFSVVVVVVFLLF